MRALIGSIMLFLPFMAFGQLGVGFHHSNLPFIGLSYEIGERWRPELRMGVDQYFSNVPFELAFMYDLAEKDQYEIYTGLGGRTTNFPGLVIPVGVNIYPFTSRQFGFHIEFAPIFGESDIVRGSWGIRYKFE